jgi:hypothetical protein
LNVTCGKTTLSPNNPMYSKTVVLQNCDIEILLYCHDIMETVV